jgi:tyrosine-protein kinase Etk/Wzc
MTPTDLAKPTATRPREDGEPEESIGEIVVRILTVLAIRKKFIVCVTAGLMMIAAVRVSLMSDSFKAEAVILPPQQQQSSLAAFSSALSGGLASGIGSQLGLKDPADFYIGILKSRTISDNIVARFHLQGLYRARLLSGARRTLMRHVSFTKSKEAFIVISVEDHDPTLATALANAFVEELYNENSQLAIRSAAQRRVFFEQELSQERDSLTEAEMSLRNSQLTTGLIMPSGQTEALVRTASELRAEISSREVQLEATRSFATEQNPRIKVLQREIAATRAQLAQVENRGEPGSNFEASAGRLPAASLEYLRKTRTLRYHETLYELLAKQYEAARIDEAKQAPVLQVLDQAIQPDAKSGPARLAIVLLVGLVGAVLSSIWVCASGAAKAQYSRPGQAVRIASLRRALLTF